MNQFDVRMFVKCFEFNLRLVRFWPLKMNGFGRWNSWDVFFFRECTLLGTITYPLESMIVRTSSGGLCFLVPWRVSFWIHGFVIFVGDICTRVYHGMQATIFPPAFQGEDFVGTFLKPPEDNASDLASCRSLVHFKDIFFWGTVIIFFIFSTSKKKNKGTMSPRFLTSEHISSL